MSTAQAGSPLTLRQRAEEKYKIDRGESVKTLSPEEAEHVGTCETCQARLKEYGQIGMALRRVASLESPEEARARTCETRQTTASSRWERKRPFCALFRPSMRVPISRPSFGLTRNVR